MILAPVVLAQTPSPEDLYKEAESAYQAGDTPKAIYLYEELVKVQPNSVEARTNLGVMLAQVGRYSEAVAQYSAALERDPSSLIVRLNLALAWYKQADFEKAAAELEKLRKQHADNQQSLYLLADCYLRLGKNHDVVTLLDPYYAANPDDRAVDYALGTALIRDGQVQRGAIVIDRVLKFGDTPEVNLLLGEARLAGGDFKGAASTIRKALDRDPALPGGWTLYGNALSDDGDYEGAKTAYLQAVKADPTDFDANLRLGGMLRHDGDFTKAAPYIEQSARLRPASPEAQYQMGALNLALGHLDEARKELEQLERAWPDFEEVHVELASLYARLDLKEDSKRERDIVLKLDEKAREKGPQPVQ
jgi:tetratricopeptide (TPR) repeat protein